MKTALTGDIRPLSSAFYRRPTLVLARDLLGRLLVMRDHDVCVGGRIVEVEAYIGESDPACHACRGRTPRNEVMYGPPGRAYVYFTYGNHWMLNVVAEPEGFPAAVLIRALEPACGLDIMHRRRRVASDLNLTNGPGKLTAAMGITGRNNGADLRNSELLIAGSKASPASIGISGRVGVSEGGEIPWRFFDTESPCVSVYRAGTRASRQATGNASHERMR